MSVRVDENVNGPEIIPANAKGVILIAISYR